METEEMEEVEEMVSIRSSTGEGRNEGGNASGGGTRSRMFGSDLVFLMPERYGTLSFRKERRSGLGREENGGGTFSL